MCLKLSWLVNLQLLVLQDIDSEDSPLQGFPPYAGGGLLHCRDRCMDPPPQLLEQPVQDVQDPQLPCWGPKENIKNYILKDWKQNLFNFKCTLPLYCILRLNLQLFALQVVESEDFPWQVFPPWAGEGESQSLSRCLVPPPQLLEQPVQEVHCPQLPSTFSDFHQ